MPCFCMALYPVRRSGLVPLLFLRVATQRTSKTGVLTITSVGLRLFHKVLASRLVSSLDLDASQNGFMPVDGTMANCTVLESYIRERRRNCKEHHVLSLDLGTAFDVVPGLAILRSIRRLGVDSLTADYIFNWYEGFTTNVTCNGIDGGEVPLRCGVRQGDPLSPILFNMVLDELLTILSNSDMGGTLRIGSRVPALAFADDLVLLGDTRRDAERALHVACEFFKASGMALNARKCHALSVLLRPRKQGLACDIRNPFVVPEGSISQCTGLDSFKYLGFLFDQSGMCPPTGVRDLGSLLTRLKKSALLPFQKMVRLRWYLIPRFIYGMQNFRVTANDLEHFDRQIRGFVKGVLHLHHSVEDALIHAPVKEGGLGVLSLRVLISKVLLGRLGRLEERGGTSAVMTALRCVSTAETV